MDNTVFIELIKQGPATITLVALAALAVGGFKYFSAFMNAAAIKDVEHRHEFLELVTSTRTTIEGLSRSIERFGSGQDRLAKAIEGLACREERSVAVVKNGRFKT